MIGAARAILATGALFMLAAAAPAADTRTATDSAGRRAELPARVERIYAAGGPATIFLYTLAPDRMLGWTRPLGPEERAFVPARYAEPRARPAHRAGQHRQRGGGAGRAPRPDLRLWLADRDLSLARRPRAAADGRTLRALRREPLRHPGYLCARGRSAGCGGSRSRAGPVRGPPARRDRPAGGARARRAAAQRVLREGPEGTRHCGARLHHRGASERLGARNVAGGLGGGMATVSPEQVLAWDPRSSSRSIRPSWRRCAPTRCGRACARCGRGACTWSRRRRFPGWTSRRQ